jgi:hypothetical protein
MSVKYEYPFLSGKAQKILFPFETSYLCEAEFSAVAVINSKYHVEINVEKEMRVTVCSLILRFEKMCGNHPHFLFHIDFHVILRFYHSNCRKLSFTQIIFCKG